jgi:hypothetical protein
VPAEVTRRCSIETSGEVSPIATATEARPVEVRALTVELVDGLIACAEL